MRNSIRVAIDSYRAFIHYLGPLDPTTTQMLKEILVVEEEHADEMAEFLTAMSQPG